MTKVRLDSFNSKRELDRGASKLKESLWILIRALFFQSPLPWPRALKRHLLRSFGAQVGEGVVIKPRVTIHFPWKLSIGDYSWIGEEVFILNFEQCTIGAHCCISQRAFLCGGNHDFRAMDFKYRNGPIVIEDGAWVGAQTFIAPSITIGQEAVITAGSVVSHSMPSGMICSGNPCEPVKERYKAKL
jgi:putative colanic acid biosynthesis acetyltransferase WcaF